MPPWRPRCQTLCLPGPLTRSPPLHSRCHSARPKPRARVQNPAPSTPFPRPEPRAPNPVPARRTPRLEPCARVQNPAPVPGTPHPSPARSAPHAAPFPLASRRLPPASSPEQAADFPFLTFGAGAARGARPGCSQPCQARLPAPPLRLENGIPDLATPRTLISKQAAGGTRPHRCRGQCRGGAPRTPRGRLAAGPTTGGGCGVPPSADGPPGRGSETP